MLIGWHLDKKVPVSIIIALILHFSGGVWWLSRLEARTAHLEIERDRQRERDDRQDMAASALDSKLQGRLDRIDGKLDRLIERSIKP